jgi:integrase
MHSQQLSEVFALFRDEERGTRSSTRQMRRLVMDYCLAAVGDIAVSEFGFEQARKVQRYLVDSPDRNAVSANSYVRMLSPVFEYAVDAGIITENPLRFLKRLREPHKRIEVYSADEVTALLAACDRMRHPDSRRAWRLRVLLATCAALRRSEVLNLLVRDVDFDRGEIWVQAKPERPETWTWGLKDYEDRKVPLPPVLARELAAVMAELPEGQPYVALTPKRYRGCQRLRAAGQWTDELGNLPDMNFRKPFIRICERAKVNYRGFHSLRATCITWWFEKGIPVHEVRVLAGHASIETTMTYYAAVRHDHVQRAADATQRIMGSLLGATGLEPATS